VLSEERTFAKFDVDLKVTEQNAMVPIFRGENLVRLQTEKNKSFLNVFLWGEI
jgi:hypothetical protein